MNFRRVTYMLISAAAMASLLLTLFFTWKGWILGILAFLAVFISGWFACRQPSRVRDHAPAWFWVTTVILGFLVFLSLVTLFASARSDGVCVTDGQPIFAKREHYLLNNHGRKTEVSRSRFLAVGASFHVGWHAMVLLGALGALRRRHSVKPGDNP